MTESVVLLHGIVRTARSMASLARRLQREGYRVLNVGYPSRRMTIARLADHIHPQIAAFLQETEGPVHFVGHSMGGLVIAAYLHRHPTARLGRIAMLGTPNHGSEVADFLRNNRLFRYAYGPAGQELCTDIAHLPPEAGEVGVIAGNVSFDPVGSWLIGKENDGKVSIESTRLATPHRHVIVAASHSFMPSNRAVQAQLLQFLKTGRFG